MPLQPSDPTPASRRTSFTTTPHLPVTSGAANAPSIFVLTNPSNPSIPQTLPSLTTSRPGTAGGTNTLSRPGTAGISLGGAGATSPNFSHALTSPHLAHGIPSTLGTRGPASLTGVGPSMQTPTNDEVEAVIQMATSSRGPSAAGGNPPRDTRTQLFVGNLPYRVRWQDLKDLFRRAGTVLRADVSLGPDNRSRGYGTVLLATAEDAGRAVDMFNGFEWMTRVLEVRPDRMGAQTAGPSSSLDSSSNNNEPPPHSAGSTSTFPPTVLSPFSGLGGLGGIGSGTPTSTGATPGGLGSLTLTQPQPVQPQSMLTRLATSLGSTGGSGPTSPFANTPGFGGDEETASGRSLFVGNLPFHIQWQDLKDLFRMSGGTVLRADVALGSDGRSRGFGMVTFASEADAERARAMFNGYEYSGRVLKVHFDKYSGAGITNNSGISSSIPSPLSISMSTPQSPNNLSAFPTGLHAHSGVHHGGSSLFAQQVMLSQHEQQGLGSGLGGLGTSGRGELSRFNSDTLSYRYGGIDVDPLQKFSNTSSKSPVLPRANTYSHPYPPSERNLSPPQAQSGPGGAASSSSSVYRTSFLYPSSPVNSGFGAGFGVDDRSSSGVYSTRFGAGVFDVGFGGDPGYGAGQTGSSALSRGVEADIMQPGSALDMSGRSEDSTAKGKDREQASGSSSAAANPTGSTSAQGQQQASQQSNSTSPPNQQSSSGSSSRSQHPAHPGPIPLPPPPHPSAFPMPPPHAISPYHHPHAHPMSPYMSPMYHPSMMGMGMPPMTPHGLPPITPSMPSFTFIPQPSPMGMPGYMPASSSSLGGEHLEPSGDGSSGEKKDENNGNGDGSTTTGTVDANDRQQQQQQLQEQASSRQRPPTLPQHPFLASAHPLMTPYTPFSPGVAMSPGAFWGRPGGANPYINPAVGAPVHPHTPHHPHVPPYYAMRQPSISEETGYFPPVPPQQYMSQQQPTTEEMQYQEPQSYFPPVPPSSSSANPARPSGLSNEITPGAEGTNRGGTSSAPSSDPSVKGTHKSESLGSAGTTSATGTGTGHSSVPTRPGSSMGTSWTDSPQPPHQTPTGVQDLTQGLDSLKLGSSDAQKSQRTQSVSSGHSGQYGSKPQPPPLPRADSDPVTLNNPPAEQKPEAHRSRSDAQTWNHAS